MNEQKDLAPKTQQSSNAPQQQTYEIDAKTVRMFYEILRSLLGYKMIRLGAELATINYGKFLQDSLKSIANDMPTLVAIAKHNPSFTIPEVISYDSIPKQFPDLTSESNSLFELFKKHTADKYAHGYHYAYSFIFNKLLSKNNIVKLLEIGLGTHDTTVPSNMMMMQNHQIGASLRAWREYCPNATIYGADIDKSILFEEERIKTYYVNQLEQQTFNDLLQTTGGEFDVIIDDGIHYCHANLNSLLFALSALKTGGVLVIEDIDLAETGNVPLWQVVRCLLPQSWPFYIIHTGAKMVIIQKNS